MVVWTGESSSLKNRSRMIKVIVTAIATAVVLFAIIVVANQLVVGNPNLIQSTASALIAGAIVGILGMRKNKKVKSETNHSA
ncbi:hypothetical protein N9B57_05185, partial [Verrucomicrobia bacterium]|jgi:amino acid permease|nr:hypothetical protein [Verrucomicrobiota bacterium]